MDEDREELIDIDGKWVAAEEFLRVQEEALRQAEADQS